MTWDFQQWLIVALFVSLFFKDEAKVFLRHKMGLKGTEDNLESGMEYMKLHYNDELSAKLDTMHSDQEEGFKAVHLKQDAMQDCIKKANNKLDTFEKFGMPIRKV